MEAEFYNLYVEKLLAELVELNKSKLLLQTQIAWQEKKMQELIEFQNKLQNANNDLLAKLKAATEKPEKKSSRKASETAIEETTEGF